MSNQQNGINHLVLQKNKLFCLAEQFGINHWILHKNKREQNGLTRSILHKNKKRADWYKSLNPEEKEKLCLAEQNGIKHWILQTKIRLYHKSKLITKPLETQFNVIWYTSPTPVVSLHLIPRIHYHPGIPVTLLTGSSLMHEKGELNMSWKPI